MNRIQFDDFIEKEVKRVENALNEFRRKNRVKKIVSPLQYIDEENDYKQTLKTFIGVNIAEAAFPEFDKLGPMKVEVAKYFATGELSSFLNFITANIVEVGHSFYSFSNDFKLEEQLFYNKLDEFLDMSKRYKEEIGVAS
jgi:hypothetical protein